VDLQISEPLLVGLLHSKVILACGQPLLILMLWEHLLLLKVLASVWIELVLWLLEFIQLHWECKVCLVVVVVERVLVLELLGLEIVLLRVQKLCKT
jgi:hypothetical protein